MGCSPWGYMTEHACLRVEGDGFLAINWWNEKKKLFDENVMHAHCNILLTVWKYTDDN